MVLFEENNKIFDNDAFDFKFYSDKESKVIGIMCKDEKILSKGSFTLNISSPVLNESDRKPQFEVFEKELLDKYRQKT